MTTAEVVRHLGRSDAVGQHRSELRCLLIDSATMGSAHIQVLLEGEFRDVAVASLDGARARHAESDYDLVRADLSLPDAEGEAVVRAVRSAFPRRN